MNINTWIAKWKDYLLIDKKFSDNTIEKYEKNLKHFKEFIEKEKIEEITKDDIVNYMASLKKEGIKDVTIANYLTSIKRFFYFLELEKVITDNPTNLIDTPRLPSTLPKVLSVEEVNKLLDIKIKTKYDARNKAMLEVLYAAGLRISELLNLKVEDVSFSDDNVRVWGKGNKERLVPLGNYAIAALKTYIDNYRHLFIKKPTPYLFLSNQGNILTRQRLFQYIKEQAVKNNIKTNFSLHTLRHSFATHMLKNGADLRSIQEMLGHASISTTQIYTNIGNQELANSYKKFHPHA